jgi:hypothetical protein
MSSRAEEGRCGITTRSLVWDLAASFDTSVCFLGGFNRSRLGCCCGSRRWLFRLGHLPGDGHVRLLKGLRNLLRSRNDSRNGGFDNSPPRTTWLHPSPRFICSAEVPACLAFGAAWLLLACSYSQKGRPLYNRRLRFFPLYTTTVDRCVFSPIATALRLSPRGTASTGEVGATTRDAPGRVSAITMRVSLALASFALQWSL